MSGRYYSQDFECPICSREFSSLRIKSSKTVLDEKDSDFCPYYKQDPPFFYTPIVCPKCGFSTSRDRFDEITDEEKVPVIKHVCQEWEGGDYGEKRDAAAAAECYQQAIKNAKAREKKASVIGPLYLRRGWCYRYTSSHRESRMLKEARKYYQQAYEEEKSFAGNLNEISILYLVGELYRRTGEPEEAVQWFSRVVEHPDRHYHKKMEKLARDQWQRAKEDRETKK